MEMEHVNFQDLLQCRAGIELIKIVFRHCTPEWHMPRARIEHANLTYVVVGEADYRINGENYHVVPGDLIYVPFGGVRQASLVRENLMHCYSIDFILRDASGAVLPLPFRPVSSWNDASAVGELFGKMSMSWLQRDEEILFRIRALFLLLLSHLVLENHTVTSAQRTVDDRIQTIMTHIERHYGDDLSLEYFASRLHLNKVYLGSVFKKHTGMSFHQFLMNARLNAAEDLLYTGRYTVNEVAELTGFQDASYFSRVFFRANGVRPGKYKRLEKPPEPRDQEKLRLPGTAGQDRFS